MDAREIAAGLSEAQRAWILVMPETRKTLTEAEFESLPDELYVQFSPDEYCPDTGCYLGGGERHWFASSSAYYKGDGGPWSFEAELNKLGLEIRSILTENAG